MQNYDKSNGLRSGWFRIFSSGGRFAIEYLLSLTSDGSGTRQVESFFGELIFTFPIEKHKNITFTLNKYLFS